jgi:hypothetical protein
LNESTEATSVEGYLFEGAKYTRRSEFYSPQKTASLTPRIFSQGHFSNLPPQSLNHSIANLLQDLAKKHSRIYLPYSGGLDSEVLLWTALKLNISVVPVIVDLFNRNSYELMFAKRFLEVNGISNAIEISISKDEFTERWLPELIFDCESLSFLLAGGYIATRLCPRDGVILLSGENPNVFVAIQDQLYFARHEYSLWQSKTARRHDLEICEAYRDPEIIKSYINYPANRERLVSQIPFSQWSADHEFLGKEYIYTDPDFKTLERRYAQHGWESEAGRFVYQKGMVPFAPSAPYQPYLNQKLALSFLLFSLKNNFLDFDLAKKVFQQDYLISLNDLELTELPKHSDFNRRFYKHIGQISGKNIIFSNENRTTLTHKDGTFKTNSTSSC